MAEQNSNDNRSPKRASGVLYVCLLLFFALTITRFIRYARTSLLALGATTGRERFAGVDLDPSKLLAGLIVMLLIAAMLYRPKKSVLRIDSPARILMLFALYSFASVAWAYAPRHTAVWSLKLLQWIVLYIVIITLTTSRRDLTRWAHLFLAASLLNMIAMIQERVAPATAFGGAAGGPTAGLYLIHYPRWAILFLPFALHSLLQGNNRSEKMAGAAAVIMNLVTVYLSQRRGGPPVVAISVFAYFIIIGWRGRRLLALLAAFVVLGATVFALDPQYAGRLASIPFPGGATLEDWARSGRYGQYVAGIEIIRQHPFVGVGMGGALLWSMDHMNVGLMQHSLLLKLGSEFGLVGLVIYGAFLYAVIRRNQAALGTTKAEGDRWGRSFAAATLASLIAMLVWAQLQPSLVHLPIYLCCGLGSATAAIFSRRSQSVESAAASSG
ncbi:MAG: O-antigen ligase family protein [Armatimonadota bacterium]